MSLIKKNYKIIFFLYLFSIVPSISQSNKDVPLNNLILHKDPKFFAPIIFEDFSGNEVKLNDYYGDIILINFWATWCKPCKDEMPSLDRLSMNKNFEYLTIFAINIEKPNKKKAEIFFNEIGIRNIKIFFDKNLNFVKEMNLRGVPTTVLINREGKEFSRILGSVDFEDEEFTKWLLKQ